MNALGRRDHQESQDIMDRKEKWERKDCQESMVQLAHKDLWDLASRGRGDLEDGMDFLVRKGREEKVDQVNLLISKVRRERWDKGGLQVPLLVVWCTPGGGGQPVRTLLEQSYCMLEGQLEVTNLKEEVEQTTFV